MDPGKRRAVESERSRWRGTPVLIERTKPVAGGSTNRCFRLHCKGGRLSPSAMARTGIVPGILLEHLDISAGADAAEGLGTRQPVLHCHRA